MRRIALATVAILTLLTGVASPGGIIPGLGGGGDSSTPASSTRHRGTVASYALSAQLSSAATADAPAAAATADDDGGTPAASADDNGAPAGPATDGGGAPAVTGDGGGGALVTTCNGLPATMEGGPGADVLEGTPGDDVIAGLGGNDIINGNGGSDTICGGDGNDVMGGGAGDDTMFGESGDDIMNGDDGNDVMDGGAGDDNMGGRNGDDTMNGGDGADIMSGHDGDDTMFGDGGNDNMNGGKDADYVDGGSGDDLMSGSNGNDILLGRAGSDVLNGGPQFDTCDLGLDGLLSKSKCENNRPVAQDVAAAALEDGPTVDGSFDADDIDSDDDPSTLAYTIVTSPSEGSVTNNGDGTFTFDPGEDFQDLGAGDTRVVTFDYKATDSNAADSDPATVTVTVTGVDDPAFAGDDDGGTTDEDTAITTSNVLVNDGDVDANDSVSVSGPANGPSGFSSDNGAAMFNNFDGTFEYDPGATFQYLAAGQSATDTFGYEIASSNPLSGTAAAQVTIQVTGLNDDPTADNQGVETSGSLVTITLTASDPDATDDLTFSVGALTGAGTLGAVVNDPDLDSATIDYTPGTPDSEGNDPPAKFDFTVVDGKGGTDSATVTINGDPGDEPLDPPAPTGVDARGQILDDGTGVEVESPGPAAITLFADAPFTPAPGAQVAGDIGDLTITIVTPLPAGHGSLTAPVDNLPNNPADPVRSAGVEYTPGAFLGETSFEFEACGDVVVAPPAVGTTFCDTATVEIEVSAATPPAPPDVAPVTSALVPDSSAVIDLADGVLGAKTDESGEPVGRAVAGASGAGDGDDEGGEALAVQAPGVYFLVDTTGSMAGDLSGVQADISAVMTSLEVAFPGIEFGLGRYRDFPRANLDFGFDCAPNCWNDFAFEHIVTIKTDDGVGGDTTDVSDRMDDADGLVGGQGGDGAEGWFYAIDQLMEAANPAGFDPDQQNVLVVIGDSPAHDPVCTALSQLPYDITEASVTSKLLEPGWFGAGSTGNGVTFIGTSPNTTSGGLDGNPVLTSFDYTRAPSAYLAPEGPCAVIGGSPGQATRLADVTGGAHFNSPAATASQLATAIAEAIDPGAALTFSVTLPVGFAGVLTDSTGTPIPAGATTSLPTSKVSYSSAGVAVGTATQFDFTVTSAATGLSATESVFINVVTIGSCEIDVNNCDDGR